MRLVAGLFAIIGLCLLVGACASVSKEECVAGDWTALGKNAGAQGYAKDRLSAVTKDCGKHGITPDANAYYAGWSQGIRLYCTPQNGFQVGRQRKKLKNVCPADLAGPFQNAYGLGNRLGEAEWRVERLEKRIDSAEYRLSSLQSKLNGFDCGGKSGDDLRKCRDKRYDIRNDLQSERFNILNWRGELLNARSELQIIHNEVWAQASRTIPGFSG